MPSHTAGPAPLRAERTGPKAFTNTKLRSTGMVIREGAKIQYAKVLEFDDRDVANRFSDAVVAAVKKAAAK